MYALTAVGCVSEKGKKTKNNQKLPKGVKAIDFPPVQQWVRLPDHGREGHFVSCRCPAFAFLHTSVLRGRLGFVSSI